MVRQEVARAIQRTTRLNRIGRAAEKIGKARIALEAAKQELDDAWGPK